MKTQVQVSLPRMLAVRLKMALAESGNVEIGGVLMGEQLAAGSFRVVDFSIDRTSGSVVHFVRSPEQHEAALNAFFHRTRANYERFNYLGEWHSHPQFSVSPSATDLGAMARIVNGTTNIDFAMLLIVRLRFWLWLDASLTAFARDRAPSAAMLKL